MLFEVLLLAILSTLVSTSDYCDVDLCDEDTVHIGCNNTGVRVTFIHISFAFCFDFDVFFFHLWLEIFS